MEKVQLKNICRPKQWKTLTGKNLVPDGKYPVYGANGIIGYYNDYNHENETLMIGCRGTCGALNISQPFSYINGNAMALDDLVDDIDIRYLYYALMGRGFQDVISGAVQPQIIRADLEKMEVWIGNKKEQKEIVDVFSKLDAVLSHRKREIQYLDDLIKARFVEMFESQAWERVRAGTIMLNMRNGVSPSNIGTYPAKVLTLSAITQGGFNPDSWKDGMFDVDPPLEKRVTASDFYMCRGNGNKKLVGVGVYSKEDRYDLIFPDTAIAATIDLHRICLPYLFYAWQQPFVRKQIEAGARTTNGTYKINQGVVSNIELALPPLKLQKQFAAFVAAIDKSKLLSGCRLFHSWAPENRDKPKHVGVPRRRTKVLRGCRRQQ